VRGSKNSHKSVTASQDLDSGTTVTYLSTYIHVGDSKISLILPAAEEAPV